MAEGEEKDERPPEFDSILETTGLDPDQVTRTEWVIGSFGHFPSFKKLIHKKHNIIIG